MKRSLPSSAVAVLAGVSLLSGCAAFGGGSETGTNGASSDKIIIGLDLDSTGPGASYSVPAGKAIDYAVKEINDKGGIGGKKIELVKENDESDATKTPAVIRKLLDRGSSAILLQSSSAAIGQAKPVIQQAQVVGLAPTAISTASITPPDADYNYIMVNALDDYAKVYCGAFQKAGYKKLGVLSDASATIDGVNKGLLPGLKQCVEIVAEEKAPLDAADVTAQVTNIKNKNPDVILVSSVGGNFEVLAHNTLAKQWEGKPRFSLASIGNQPSSWKQAAPGSLKGLIFMGTLSSKNPRTTQFIEKYGKAQGADYTVSAYETQGYDSIYLLKEAFEKAGGSDRKKVYDAFNNIKGYKPHFGQENYTISFAKDKHNGSDGLCGLVLTEFGGDNKPSGPWATYQPPC